MIRVCMYVCVGFFWKTTKIAPALFGKLTGNYSSHKRRNNFFVQNFNFVALSTNYSNIKYVHQ